MEKPVTVDQGSLWHEDRVTRTVYATDNSIYQLRPAKVGLPQTSTQIAAALEANYAKAKPQPIVARGGGTGTNGQSLTHGLAIDLKRSMNRVIEVNADLGYVDVEPGVVTAELNAQLFQHGLFWPPHTSTLNRATVGGMVSTDAAGKGSLVYGRTHRHVERLEMLLDDGSEWTAEPVTIDIARQRAAEGGRGGELWRGLLDLVLDEATELSLPELARGFSGYGLDRLRVDAMIDPVALVCGAEGTLGIITKARLKLSPLPTVVRLVVASYATFDDALRDAVALRNTGPTAIESFDETTLDRGRSSPAWPALGGAIGDHHGAVLLLEYTNEAAADIKEIMTTIESTGRSVERKISDDAVDQAAVWKVRADAVGLLAKVAVGGPELSARPTAFVEDCAVPVVEMPAFIAGFRKILDEAGLMYAMFGHADVGCVHVRPALDLTNATQRALVAQVTKSVTELVAKHGGLVWGEHGRGFRGAHVNDVLPPATVQLMREVKTAFDPRDIFNPGKLYRPVDSNQGILDVDDPPMRGQSDESVPVSIRRDYGSAFACNGNGLCHHYDADEVMCPSYKATGDPALSPKGRADLIRSWLSDGDAIDDAYEHALAKNLHQCLSCSACSGRCPVEVDIPEVKSRFLHEYYSRNRRPVSHLVMSQFEQLATFASRFPKLASLGLKPAERVLGLVDLPGPSPRGTASLARFNGESGFDVVLMPDVFTFAIEPETLAKAVEVLARLDYRVGVSRFVASGKFDHVKGKRPQFEKAVRRQADMVRQIAATGARPVVIEPAVALLHLNEYPALVDSYPSSEVQSLARLITDRIDRLDDIGSGSTVRLLGHCTERATQHERAAQWIDVLIGAGYGVEAPNLGCCGMAGVFGHEEDNQDMSRKLWEMSWAKQFVGTTTMSTSVDHLAATGYSCRSQAKRFAGHAIVHPLHLL